MAECKIWAECNMGLGFGVWGLEIDFLIEYVFETALDNRGNNCDKQMAQDTWEHASIKITI